MTPEPRRAGFTLIELAVVTVLIGLMAVTVSLATRGLYATPSLQAGQRVVQQAVAQARLQARARHRPTAVVLDLDARRCGVVLGGAEPAAWYDLGGATQVQAGYRGGRIQTTGRFGVRLTPTGASLPWAVELRRETARICIAVDGLTGRVTAWPDRTLSQVEWDAP